MSTNTAFRSIVSVVLMGALLFILSACESNDIVGPDTIASSSIDISASSAVDGETGYVDLIAGQHTVVGKVKVEKDNDTATITYQTHGFWCITEWHLHVGDKLSDIPTTNRPGNRSGNPIPGHFEYSGTEDCATEVVQVVSIDGFSSPIYVAAHAVVQSGADDADYIFAVTNATAKIYRVDVINKTSSLFFDTGLANGSANWPNGLAFDEVTGRLYFVDEISGNVNKLYFIDVNDPSEKVLAGTLDSRSAGAVMYEGKYFYIPHNVPTNDDLRKVSFNPDGTIDSEDIAVGNFTGIEGGATYRFGDLAAKDGTIYLHGNRVSTGIEFSTINLATGDYTLVSSEKSPGELYEAKLQLAFGDDGTLYGHQTFVEIEEGGTDGTFYTIDLETGFLTQHADNIDGLIFNDMAPAPKPEFEEETAWGAGERFVDRGNWATYFKWKW